MELLLNIQTTYAFFVGPFVSFFVALYVFMGLGEAMIYVSQSSPAQPVRIVNNASDL